MRKPKLLVIKIGGNVFDQHDVLTKFIADFSSLSQKKILVHGGGTIATNIGEKLGIESKYINGRRITDAAGIDLVTMVYGGLINKQLVAQLQHHDCNAFGLTGADGNVMKAVKRSVTDHDYGFVGDVDPENVNVSIIQSLLSSGVVPVFAPLTSDDGMMLNTNADTIAAALAIALSETYYVRLIYCFDKNSVLMDVNDDNSTIEHLPEDLYQRLLTKNIFSDGILPKLENAFNAVRRGVKEVVIGSASDLVMNTTNNVVGTLITL